VSYDIAVWTGDAPRDRDDAIARYEQLMAANHMAPAWKRLAGRLRGAGAPNPALERYADDLLERYPDVDDGSDHEPTPWADAPLKANIVGDLFYFPLAYDQVETAVPFIAERAAAHGLVCFDPQTEEVLTPPADAGA
jgi:hypothetical protein